MDTCFGSAQRRKPEARSLIRRKQSELETAKLRYMDSVPRRLEDLINEFWDVAILFTTKL